MRPPRGPALAAISAAAMLCALLAEAAAPAPERHLTWDRIQEEVRSLQAAHPGLAALSSLGRTAEGRDIPLLKLSDNVGSDEDEPEALLIAGCHPREQAPQVSLMALVRELLEGYEARPEIRGLLDGREIWVVPVLNVDGKVYDFEDRDPGREGKDWRKNRRSLPGGLFGVDLNRNFAVRWGGNRQLNPTWMARTTDAGAPIYEGPAPHSEPEVAALARFMTGRPLRLFVDVHSPLRKLLCPSYLAPGEAERYRALLEGMRARQKEPYPGPARLNTGDTPPGERNGDTGLTYTWAYYVEGITAFNLETGLPGRYPLPSLVAQEYRENVRGPLLSLLEVADRMPRRTDAAHRLAGSATNLPPAPGTVIEWRPEIEGEWEYAVLVSPGEKVVVQSEFRRSPLKSGFTLQVQPEARPGDTLPLRLYVWDDRHSRTILRTGIQVAGVQ